MIVVGVDPGGRYTGIVIAETTEWTGALRLVTHRTVTRAQSGLPVPVAYVKDVLRAVQTMFAGAPVTAGRWVMGVESMVTPVSHIDGKLQVIDPEPLLAATFVAGVVVGTFTRDVDAVYQVPPGGNGQAAYQQYPLELVSAQERTQPAWQIRQAGKGNLRHVRSAWDVARRAEQMDRPHRRQG